MSAAKEAGKDLGAVFDAHIKAEFVDKDVARQWRRWFRNPT